MPRKPSPRADAAARASATTASASAQPVRPWPALKSTRTASRVAARSAAASSACEVVGMVDDDAEPERRRSIERDQPLDLRRRDLRRRDVHAGYSALHHDFGLAERGAADADGSRLDLAARDLHRFVGLGMRPQLQRAARGRIRPSSRYCARRLRCRRAARACRVRLGFPADRSGGCWGWACTFSLGSLAIVDRCASSTIALPVSWRLHFLGWSHFLRKTGVTPHQVRGRLFRKMLQGE